MAGTFEWADLCDQHDEDLANGQSNTYPAMRVWVETLLKTLAFKAWSSQMPHQNPLTLHKEFIYTVWVSSHA
jgi:hypothetical protein